MNRTRFLLLTLVTLIVTTSAQSQQLPFVDPISPKADTLIFKGRMVDKDIASEEIRVRAYPAGDCNGDGIQDWLREQYVDSAVQHIRWSRYRRRVLLYFGKENRFPEDDEGYRVGPSDLPVQDEVLAIGDYDNDTWPDIVIRRFPLNDSLHGTDGVTFYEVIVYWGDSRAMYSDRDTTHLMCGADTWLPISGGTTLDINNDGFDDLVLHCGAGYFLNSSFGLDSGGVPVPIPELHIFSGNDHQRWGRNGITQFAFWTWWKMPVRTINAFAAHPIDVNCDGVADLAMYVDKDGKGSITLLYGRENAFPDTTDVEFISYDSLKGNVGRLMDVTGDNVLDFVLLTDRFSQQRIRVFAGEPGNRLYEMVGEPADSSHPEWREPWAAVPTSNALDNSWGDAGAMFYDVGDGNLDGYNDIWIKGGPTGSPFNIIGFYSTNIYLDSLIDGYYNTGNVNVRHAVNLGNIDGSGQPTLAIGYSDFAHLQNGIVYLQPQRMTPNGRLRQFPHPEGVSRCNRPVSVPSLPVVPEVPSSLELTIQTSQ